MTTAFLLDVTSAFALKSKKKTLTYFSYFSGGTCYVANGNTDQPNCSVVLTGPQCTYQGTPIYQWDVSEPTYPVPQCSIAFRQPW